MKTIKQIADELGVSKQAVRDKIAKLGLQSSLQKNGKSFAVPVSTEKAVQRAFDGNQPQRQSQSTDKTTDKLIAMLEVELAIKNKQIDELNARLAEAHSIINSEQQLHGGTIQHQLINSTDEQSPNDEEELEITVIKHKDNKTKRGLFGLFNRNS